MTRRERSAAKTTTKTMDRKKEDARVAARRRMWIVSGVAVALLLVLMRGLATDSEEIEYQIGAAQREMLRSQKSMRAAVLGEEPPFGAAVPACDSPPQARGWQHFKPDAIALQRLKLYVGEIARLTPSDSYELPASTTSQAAGAPAAAPAQALPVNFACNQSTATTCQPGTEKAPRVVSAGQACDERVYTKEKTCFDAKNYAGDFRCMLINAADLAEGNDTLSAMKPLPPAILKLGEQGSETRRLALETFPFMILFGDVWEMMDKLLLVKSRPVKEPGLGMLLPLHRTRHFTKYFELLRDAVDPPFLKKPKGLVWRGGSTGPFFCQCNDTASGDCHEWNCDAQGKNCVLKRLAQGENLHLNRPVRSELLERWYHGNSRIDVALSGISQCPEKYTDQYEKYSRMVKPRLDLNDLLQYRYQLSVEGNDVATNTKWILASNSLLFMPVPTMESWLLESQLVPYTHYVPVKSDFTDLADQVAWADAHPAECQKMIKAANAYIDGFSDVRRERWVEAAVFAELYRYTRANPGLLARQGSSYDTTK